MMPLSQVLSYNTVHLIDAAAHWRGLADQREETFASVRNEAYILSWEGIGADALHERTNADYSTAMESSENLRQAAIIAQDGASTLDQLHSRVLYTLEDAQADGFSVSEDLSVIDTHPPANPLELAQRQAQAQAYASGLKAQIADLLTHDAQVGTDMTNAAAGEGKIWFVDHTFKKDPFNNPIPDPPHPAPPGKIWNLHHDGYGGNWKFQDALKQCSGGDEFWDIAGAAGALGGGVIAGPWGIPFGVAGAGGYIHEVEKCEAP
jgi:hypothetical protein